MMNKKMKKEKWDFVFLLFIIVLLSATFVSAAFDLGKITGRVIDTGESTGNILTNLFDKLFGIQGVGTSATRSMPSTYTPGVPVTVTLTVNFDSA